MVGGTRGGRCCIKRLKRSQDRQKKPGSDQEKTSNPTPAFQSLKIYPKSPEAPDPCIMAVKAWLARSPETLVFFNSVVRVLKKEEIYSIRVGQERVFT